MGHLLLTRDRVREATLALTVGLFGRAEPRRGDGLRKRGIRATRSALRPTTTASDSPGVVIVWSGSPLLTPIPTVRLR